MISAGTRVLEVRYAKHFTEGRGWNNKKFYYFSNNQNIKKGEVICIEPNIASGEDNELEFGLQFAKVTNIIEVYNGTEECAVLTVDDRIDKAKYVETIIQIDLKDYFDNKAKKVEMNNLKKELDTAVTQIDEFLKYKQLAELNPKYKEIFDRYIQLSNPKNNLLSENNEETK